MMNVSGLSAVYHADLKVLDVRQRTPLRTKELARIRCPVLIIQVHVMILTLVPQLSSFQNEQSPVAPLKHAEHLQKHLRDAHGNEPRLYVIKGSCLLCCVSAKDNHLSVLVPGAKACMSIIPGSASLVNQVLSKFLAQLPRERSDLLPSSIPILERTKMALRTLSELVGDPSIAHRNPKSLLSFSCVTPEVAKSQLENLKFYAKDIDKTYCPLGSDGRPIRK